MKHFFITLGMLGLAVAAHAGEKPNLLFIFADDHSYEAVRAFGYLDIDTPNLDRLVDRGASFTHVYNMGAWNGAVCIASRAMLNSGRYVWRARGAVGQDAAQGRLWSQLMKKAGYKTYMTGKWHVPAVSPEAVFDVVRDVRGGMPEQHEEGYNRPLDEADSNRPDAWKPWNPKYGGYWEGGRHWSETVGDNGIEFVRIAAESDQPFFMYLAFNAPHDPRQAPKEYVDRYPLDRIAVPISKLPEYPYAEQICGKQLRDERLAPYPRSDYAVKVNRQEYFAIITHMDDQIGRILDALEASGLAGNTYVVFTADHGLAVGHHGLIGKQNMYDHSMRVPFMIVGPGIEPGSQVNAPIYLQDIMPTALELAGLDKPDSVDFKSILPLLRKEQNEQYDALYGAYMDRQRMVIKDGYKLIMYPEAGVCRLYHLEKDPLEMNDLAGEPGYASVIAALKAGFAALQAEVGDELDLERPKRQKDAAADSEEKQAGIKQG